MYWCQTFNPYTHLPVNVILAKALLGKYFKPEGENGVWKIIKKVIKLFPGKYCAEFKGTELEGCRYEQLLPFEANQPANELVAIHSGYCRRFCNH